ncbi:hypothetical protein BC941DRAFT_516866 [Chlamydoabsidia padenii]|nr:hypothetical protein BC941DRAFT_516866 [Chlamydoabsidia padenii]
MRSILLIVGLMIPFVYSQVPALVEVSPILTKSDPLSSHSLSPKPSSSSSSLTSFTPIITHSSHSSIPTSSSITRPSITTPFFTSSSSSISISSSSSFSSTFYISSSSSPSPTMVPTPTSNDGERTTPTIVGAVVGGVVGLALLGGLLSWMNRRGGCTSKTNQRKANYEDFGLAERDFPHHRSPIQQPQMSSSSGFGGSTMVASPTLSRLNNQGNYYHNEEPTQYHYYSPHQEMTGYDGGYYDEHGYYYNPHHQQQYYPEVYKQNDSCR